MPKIQTSQRQRMTQAGSYGGMSTKAPGTSDLGPALQQASNVIGQMDSVYQKWQEEADNTILQETKLKLRQKQQDLIHNKDKGFSRVRGKQAAEMYQQYKDEYDNFAGEVVGGVSERLRDRVSLMADGFKIDVDNQLNSHTGREMEAHKDQVFKANMQSLKDHAVLNARETTGRIGAVIEEQQAEIDKYGQSKGWDPDQILAANTKAASDIHSGVISKLINEGDDILAERYFKQVKERGEVTAEDGLRMEKLLELSSTLGVAQREGDNAITEVFVKEKKLSTVLADVRKRYKNDPKRRAAAVKEIKNRIAEQEVVRKEDMRIGMQQATDYLYENKTTKGLPPALLDKVGEGRRAAMEKVEYYMARGLDVPTNRRVYEDFYYGLTNADPAIRDQYLSKDPNDHIHELSKADRDKILSLRKMAINAKSKSDPKLARLATNEQMIKTAIGEHKISDTKKDLFTRRVREAADEWQQKNNKLIPNEDLAKIISGELKNIVVGKHIGLIDDLEVAFTVKYSDIPDEDINQITQYLAARQLPINERTIREVYVQAREKKDKK